MTKYSKKTKKEVMESLLGEEFSLDGMVTYDNEGEMLVGDPRKAGNEKNSPPKRIKRAKSVSK